MKKARIDHKNTTLNSSAPSPEALALLAIPDLSRTNQNTRAISMYSSAHIY